MTVAGTSLGRKGFDYQPRTRLVFGVGAADEAGVLARGFGVERVLLVTDPGIVLAGHAGRVEAKLRELGLEVFCYDRVSENPTTRDIEACLVPAREGRVQAIIGLGGGSSLDTAKGCNFILTNGGRIQDYWGVGKATKPMLPMIAIPTTAGTGSECQSAALIADAVTHQKMACLDPKAAARIAILDAALTVSQPAAVTAHTGVDAITHAIETAVTASRTPLSLMFSHQALKLLLPGLPVVLEQPENLEARGAMLLGAAFAGLAIENSMLGAAHAAANPLTAHYGIVHGEAVGVMLPHVIRFNAEDAETRRGYAELASTPEIACVTGGVGEAVEELARRIEGLFGTARIARRLSDLGVRVDDIPSLAEEASLQWTARHNPRPISVAQFEGLYRAAWSGGEG